MNKFKSIIVFLLIVFAMQNLIAGNKTILSGKVWCDTKGNVINAHGGGILKYGNTYYWFGEHKAANTNNATVGVTCYSSKNLMDWTNRGVALAVSDDENSDITKGCVIERPKVVYNEKTKTFVMWFHLELKGKGYSAARYGVAVSKKVTGPYIYIRCARVNANIYPIEMTQNDISLLDTMNVDHFPNWWTPDWRVAIKKGLFLKRDFTTGQMARDQTIFVDDDKKAYHIYSSEDNLTLQIAELSDDYQSHTGKYTRVAACGQNEAPAMFKKDGVYWLITSGCTGWNPNAARMFRAENIWGPWTQLDNPCEGENASTTFGGQGTYILRVGNTQNYIFMADIWRPKNPIDGRYIWLPIEFRSGKPYIRWIDKWNLDIFNN